MDRPRIIRLLRISASALCLIAGLLLVALWARSYETADRLHGRFWGRHAFLLASKEGRVAAVALRWHGAPNWWRWGTISYPVDDELSFPLGPVRQYENALGFGWLHRPIYMVMRSTQTLPDGTSVMVFGAATATLQGTGPIIPYWFLVLLTCACAAAPWIRKRFSLRTLLITVTLVAVGLGLIVAFA
jgi:hypothetical protein